MKHDVHAKMIDDNALFEEGRNWMSACEETFMRREIQANLYLDSMISRGTK